MRDPEISLAHLDQIFSSKITVYHDDCHPGSSKMEVVHLAAECFLHKSIPIQICINTATKIFMIS